MRQLINSISEKCVGCNKCIRVCPIETANITYLDENENIKVKINSDKCIACGACITACKHESRCFTDDTDEFFNDLSKGISISLIVAPAIRSNFPNWRRLFTYLKQLGVKKIYDVSLGADICTWAHLRYIVEKKPHSIITQPCPVIVKYCEVHRNELLQNLSPVHSPMACTAVYMREYEGIYDKIAAISPCIAKKNEFDEINIINYNVTFSKIVEYIKNNKIELPLKEMDFDHYECGLGSIYPMPGGLKENIEFFMGHSLRVDKSEGANVYKTLDEFIETSDSVRPHVFDVLNCAEGCNIGSACVHNKTVFEINKAMDTARREATNERGLEYYQEVYAKYDKTFKLTHFLRRYKAYGMDKTYISEEAINNAFKKLGKDTYVMQNFDCGACGSQTCYEMARKIALNLNIPMNCAVKSRDDARREHQENLNIYEKNITYTEKMNEIYSNVLKLAGNVNNHVDSLTENINEYSEMAKSIDKISEMINIIAVNASIEASRAGVHGKAFGVVATEIKKLAEDSQKTVSVTERLSEKSQKDTFIISKNINEIKDMIS